MTKPALALVPRLSWLRPPSLPGARLPPGFVAVLACLAALGCSKNNDPRVRPTEPARAVADAAPGPTARQDPRGEDAGFPDAGDADAADAGDAAPPPRALGGKVVLHAGDSMVGGDGGLTKALRAKFTAEGAKFVRDYEVSVSVATFSRTKRFPDLLARHKPDIVILTLGANDVFVPFPQAFAGNVQAIVKKIGDRECYWIGPPTWKPDTGIVAVIRENVAPCKLFDSSNLPLKRGGDRIHPTEQGGADWADLFWAYFRGNGSAAPGLLDAGR